MQFILKNYCDINKRQILEEKVSNKDLAIISV